MRSHHPLLNERRAGVLLHVTSLPGPHGVGDFGPAAFEFVDWLARAGMRLWQWLPTTPLGPGNSPYQSPSAFAGSPLMVALEPLVERGWLSTPTVPDAAAGGGDRVAFDEVIPWREGQLRQAFAGFEAKGDAADHHALATWAATRPWLADYTLFMALFNTQGWQPWWQWPAPLRMREAQALAQARQAHAREIAFHAFVQWCWAWQHAALHAHAKAHGVALIGDIPIYVADNSADVWAHPDAYFLTPEGLPSVVAGVPPDALGPEGQRWGNPLYRWGVMAQDGFAWWTARLKHATALADIVRIDHFRGFAAYWEVPADAPTAQTGRWVPGPGQALFDALATHLGDLPIIAEDLGIITPDVDALIDACGFPRMKVLCFAFADDGRHPYLPHNHERAAIAYTTTHDTDTLAGWWAQASAHERHLAALCWGPGVASGSEPVHWAALRHCLASPAALAVTPLQDVLGLPSSERMNTPGTLGEHNWSWRMPAVRTLGDAALRLRDLAWGSGRMA